MTLSFRNILFGALVCALSVFVSACSREPVRGQYGAELLQAVKENDVAAVSALLARGGDPNAALAGSAHPLLGWACLGSDPAIAEALLAAGADVNAADRTGNRALHWAVIEANAQLVRLLLAKKPQLDAKNDRGATALHYAANLDRKEAAQIVQLLLKAGAGPAIADADGRTPADWARSRGRTDLARILGAAAANK